MCGEWREEHLFLVYTGLTNEGMACFMVVCACMCDIVFHDKIPVNL